MLIIIFAPDSELRRKISAVSDRILMFPEWESCGESSRNAFYVGEKDDFVKLFLNEFRSVYAGASKCASFCSQQYASTNQKTQIYSRREWFGKLFGLRNSRWCFHYYLMKWRRRKNWSNLKILSHNEDSHQVSNYLNNPFDSNGEKRNRNLKRTMHKANKITWCQTSNNCKVAFFFRFHRRLSGAETRFYSFQLQKLSSVIVAILNVLLGYYLPIVRPE